MKVFVFGVAVALVTSLVSAGKPCSPTKSCPRSNACCSATGICGRGPEFCGAGCQGGSCLLTPVPTPTPTRNPTTTVTAMPSSMTAGNATAVTGGRVHTCALLSDGSVRCWGYNGSGQLGDGTYRDRHTPVSVISVGGAARAVVAGAYHTCALLRDGSVKCWGDNYYGPLGDGTGANRYTPVSVISLGGAATAVTGGSHHTCALLSDGSVRCWGYNGSGQLGDGTYANSYTPVSVISLGGAARAVEAGVYHTCALLSDGSVRCWGHNNSGQLGDGTRKTRYTPVSVISLGGAATAVAAGEWHTCALLSDGSVRCWGDNSYGQLGDGTNTSTLSPVSVVSLGGAATAVEAGAYHTCALFSDGSVKCWGQNYSGQLGDGTDANRYTPVSVISLGGATTAVAAGIYHMCALLSDASVRCWGDNYSGQLGDGTRKTRYTPVTVNGFLSQA